MLRQKIYTSILLIVRISIISVWNQNMNQLLSDTRNLANISDLSLETEYLGLRKTLEDSILAFYTKNYDSKNDH